MPAIEMTPQNRRISQLRRRRGRPTPLRNWPLATRNGAPSWTNATVGEVCTFQTVIWALFEPPPLLKARPTPSGPVK
jgi:hypothetical protein